MFYIFVYSLKYSFPFWEAKSWLKIESKQPTWKLAEKSLFVDKMDVLLRIDEMDVSHIDKKEDIEAIINQRIFYQQSQLYVTFKYLEKKFSFG